VKTNAHRGVGSAARAVLAAGLWAACGLALACGEEFRGDALTIERAVGTTAAGKEATMHVLGAGWIHAVEIVKRGGSSDNTYVTLELDGKEMLTASFAQLKNPWMQLATPYIVANVTTVGDTSTMTIWYMSELKFKAIVALRIDVEEDGVEGFHMSAMMNRPAPHEHIGQQAAALALPAFK
jgi:hypothetical protein